MVQEKKKFSPLRFYLVNLIFLVLIILASVLVFMAGACDVRNVKVEGSTYYSDIDIRQQVLNDSHSNNGAWVVMKNTLHPVSIPFVRSIRVKLHGLHDLTITVKEKEITGYIQQSDKKIIYLNRDGVVTDIDDRLLTGMIPVEGLDTKKKIKTGSLYPAAENRVSALAAIFHSKDNMDLTITKVTFGDSGQITLQCNQVNVMLGTADNLHDKLIRLSYILPKVGDRAGTLHFENYSGDNTDIVFDAATDESEEKK